MFKQIPMHWWKKRWNDLIWSFKFQVSLGISLRCGGRSWWDYIDVLVHLLIRSVKKLIFSLIASFWAAFFRFSPIMNLNYWILNWFHWFVGFLHITIGQIKAEIHNWFNNGVIYFFNLIILSHIIHTETLFWPNN